MYLYSLLEATYAVEKFASLALWMTVGVLAITLLTGAIVFFKKKEAFGTYAQSAFFAVAAYLLLIAIVFFALDIAKNYSDTYTEKNWLDKQALVRFVLIPLLALASVTLIGATVYAFAAKSTPEKKKPVGIVCASICGAALVIALVCLAVYYGKKISDDGYYNSDTTKVNQIALYVCALLAVIAIVGLTLFDKQKFSFDTRSLSYAGICTAMSFALSYIKLWDLPYGGSVTLASLLPLMLYSYIFGAKKGVFVGFTYGVLQAVQDPWIIHPAQFLLDYPIAFAAVGLAGLLRKIRAIDKTPQMKFAIGAMVAGTMRFICHVLSGVFAFEVYAKGQNVWVYSLLYNLYVFLDVAIVIVVGAFVLSSKSFVKTIETINKPSEQKAKATKVEKL